MGPKNTYSIEEYNALKTQVVNLKRELAFKDEEIYNLKFLNGILKNVERGEGYEKVRKIIAEETEKRSLYEKHQYYGVKKKVNYDLLKAYVNKGIYEIEELANLLNVSGATIRRSLQDMGMYPLPKPAKPDFSKMKLSI